MAEAIETSEDSGSDAEGAAIGIDVALERARKARPRKQGQAPAGDSVADALLAKQTEKLQHEIEHLKLRSLNEYFTLVLKGVAAAAALVAVAAVVVLVVQASQSRALIVEPFHTPPDLTQSGLDGTVLASRVLDKLDEMRNARSLGLRASASYSGESNQELKLEIPQTGVSLGELGHLLRDWLGHDTHISGSLTHVGDQLALTARVEGEARTFTGPQSDLDRLVEQVAASIFEATQPLSYADYLRTHDHQDEAIALLQRHVGVGSRADRTWAYLALGETYRAKQDLDGALHAYREAAALNPRLWLVWEDTAILESRYLHDDQRAAEDYHRAALATDFGGAQPEAARLVRATDAMSYDESVGDFTDALAQMSGQAESATDPDNAYQASYYAGYETAYAHDVAQAGEWILRVQDRAAGASPTFRRVDPIPRIRFWIAYDLEDWQTAADQMALTNAQIDPSQPRSAYWLSLEAMALARLGKVAEARAIEDGFTERCYICMEVRGMIAEAAGDRAAADAKFAEATRMAPSLVRAYTWWGEAKLARGDLSGAAALFRTAHEKGPHFADPLGGWGEALMRQGDAAGAVAKFSEADRWAPHWGRNHLRWAEALARLGKTGEARKQRDVALGLGLSAADRVTLTQLKL